MPTLSLHHLRLCDGTCRVVALSAFRPLAGRYRSKWVQHGLCNDIKLVKACVTIRIRHKHGVGFGAHCLTEISVTIPGRYDPEQPLQQQHREFLRDKVVFREVVPITDPSLRAKIHQTYRIGYLKDVILPRRAAA